MYYYLVAVLTFIKPWIAYEMEAFPCLTFLTFSGVLAPCLLDMGQ